MTMSGNAWAAETLAGATASGLWTVGSLWLLPPFDGSLAPLPLHGGAPSPPVPGWLVLLGSVFGLWAVVSVVVVAVDRLSQRFRESR